MCLKVLAQNIFIFNKTTLSSEVNDFIREIKISQFVGTGTGSVILFGCSIDI